jgi:hypothetical protein
MRLFDAIQALRLELPARIADDVYKRACAAVDSLPSEQSEREQECTCAPVGQDLNCPTHSRTKQAYRPIEITDEMVNRASVAWSFKGSMRDALEAALK